MGAAVPVRAGPTRLRSWPLTFLKGMSLGPDTPWSVVGRASGVPGGREHIFPKSVRDLEVLELFPRFVCLFPLYLPWP